MSSDDKAKSEGVREYRPELPGEYRDSKRLIFVFSFLIFTITFSGKLYNFSFGSYFGFESNSISSLYIEVSIIIVMVYIIIHMYFQLENTLKVWRLKNYDMSKLETTILELSRIKDQIFEMHKVITEEKLNLFSDLIRERLIPLTPAATI